MRTTKTLRTFRNLLLTACSLAITTPACFAQDPNTVPSSDPTTNLPLRPAQPNGDAPASTTVTHPAPTVTRTTTTSTAPVQISPDPNGVETAPTGQEDAKNSAANDFTKHTSSPLVKQKNKPNPVPSGNSGEKSPAILDTSDPVAPGPSRASGDPTLLEEIQLKRPALQSLISVNDYLNPFQLDASNNDGINLRKALNVGLDQNLDLAISRTNTKQRKFAYLSSLGNFLPDGTAGYSDYMTKGQVGLPVGASSLFGGGAGSLGASGGTTAFAGGTNGTTIHINHPFQIMHAGIEFYAYRGGSVMFGALGARHNLRAAQHQEKASLSDTLMTISQSYYNLLLAETLLQIRIDAVRTSEEQLRLNQDRFHSGLATHLDVLQSETQLSRDKQALVDQQISRRSNAITLADALNINLGTDLMPAELSARKVRLVDPRLNISDILQMAIDNRPELKQYEELRKAAKSSIMVAAANLQPSVLLSGNAYGIGPPNNVGALGVFAVSANWRLRGMGTVDTMDIQQARWQARQASLQSQKELQTVVSQVRNSYLQILDREKNIEETSREVRSSLEELRLAELRKSSGLGLNLDIITAQRDYTQALVNKAQAIINFNIAQAQLVHDTGLISVDALTSGRLLSKAATK